jgi:hypothetical protein
MITSDECWLTPDYPIPDYPRAFRICTEGVLLQGHFTTPAMAIPLHDAYDNHPAVDTNHKSVEARFVKEEEKIFHIHLPRFLIHFIPGLVLAPLQWALRKGKGCICVDCTNGPDLTASPKTSIPKPSATNADECPPVLYKHACACHLHPYGALASLIPGRKSSSIVMTSRLLSGKFSINLIWPLFLLTCLVLFLSSRLVKSLAPSQHPHSSAFSLIFDLPSHPLIIS